MRKIGPENDNELRQRDIQECGERSPLVACLIGELELHLHRDASRWIRGTSEGYSKSGIPYSSPCTSFGDGTQFCVLISQALGTDKLSESVVFLTAIHRGLNSIPASISWQNVAP